MSVDEARRELARITEQYEKWFGARGKRRGPGRPRNLRTDRHGFPLLEKRARGRPKESAMDRAERLAQLWTWYALVCCRWEAHRDARNADPIAYYESRDQYPEFWRTPRARALCDVATRIGVHHTTLSDAIRVGRRSLNKDARFRHLLAAFAAQRRPTHTFITHSDGMIFPEPRLVKLGDVFKVTDTAG
jgi:hypothetical protein